MVKLSITVQHHLSESLIEMGLGNNKKASAHIQFVQHLTFHYRDLNKEVDVDDIFERFQLCNPHLKF